VGLPCTVSETDGDFSRKLQIFLTPVFLMPPAEGVPLEFGIGARDQKLDGLPDGQQSFKIGLPV